MITEKKATLKDIAQEAGVSTCLVSKVLNRKLTGPWVVSEKTTSKILNAAKKLDYKPNFSARTLAGRPKKCIGLFLDVETDFTSPFIQRSVGAIVKRAEELGYSVNLGLARDNESLKLIDRDVIDSVILIHSASYKSNKISNLLKEKNVPFVNLNTDEYLPFNAVNCNDRRGMQITVDYLRSLGHEKIAFIAYPQDHKSYTERKEEFSNLCGKNGVIYNQVGSEYMRNRLHETTNTFIEPEYIFGILKKPESTAYIIQADDLLHPFYESCFYHGLKIPEDISVIGINDTLKLEKFLLKPTMLKLPIAEMSSTSVDMLDQLIKTGKPVPAIEFKEELSIRESCSQVKHRR